MTRYRKARLAAALALAATLGSSVVPARVVTRDPASTGCETACEVAAGGWPYPYVVDSLHLSPGGSVSLVEAWLGLDVIWYDALSASFLAWLGLAALLVRLIGRPGGARAIG